MQCTQAEKLIPLYAGADLPGEQTVELRNHLESCAQCQQLVAEFEASRDWLSSFAAPEFDEATLAGVRDRVLEEIGRIEKRPRLREWILPGWNPRFAFAASMVALLLIAAFAFYVFRSGPPRALPRQDTIAGKSGAKDPAIVDRRENKTAAVNDKRRSQKPLRKIRPNDPNESVQSQDRIYDEVVIAQSPASGEPAIKPPDNSATTQNNLAVNREMTRIEFQTADPNIRIIWLTPKEAISTKPNTNIR
jgi:hypothetical protein